MKTVEIIVMGKTGAGKSTLINAVLEEDLAPTGTGQAVTRENKTYKKEMMIPTGEKIEGQYGLVSCALSMYDTVGLEIDQTITESTLERIKDHIQEVRKSSVTDDISMVWFCVSERGERFESYEIDLIKKLSIDYEIPFVIVLTQSILNKKGDLERQIEEALPDVPLTKVLAKEYPIAGNNLIPPKGVEDLLRKSLKDYRERKVKILEKKINQLDVRRKERIAQIESEGNRCIEECSSAATKIGILPVGCIPFVHGICINMIVKLNGIAGIKGGKALASDIFISAAVGVILTPIMAVPFLSIAMASAYIDTVGENYLKVLVEVIDNSTDRDLKDNALMVKRIKEELQKLKKEDKQMTGMTGEERFKQQREELERKLDSFWEEDLPTANIIVAGITGTGKSTLINAIFGSEVAKTGSGRPVTEHIDEYQNNDIPVHIWDTVGLELDSEKTAKTITSIKDIITEKANTDDPFDRIHAIWYCINSGSNRYQEVEQEFIKQLYSTHLPFVIVLTQCYGGSEKIKEFEDQIKKINKQKGMDDISIFRVLAKNFDVEIGDKVISIPAFGLDKLVQETTGRLPDFIKSGFVAAQRVSKEKKREQCEKIICDYAKAAHEGFWDKVPLVNIFTTDNKIIKMFEKIGKTYNTILSEESVKKIISRSKVDFENNFWGLVAPFDIVGYSNKVSDLFSEKKKDGFNVSVDSIPKNDRAARMIAFYGYTFIDSIEELWEKLTEEQLKDVETVVDRLTEIINEKLGIFSRKPEEREASTEKHEESEEEQSQNRLLSKWMNSINELLLLEKQKEERKD